MLIPILIFRRNIIAAKVYREEKRGRFWNKTTSVACCGFRPCKQTMAVAVTAFGCSWPRQWLKLHYKHTHFFQNECETNFYLLETKTKTPQKGKKQRLTSHYILACLSRKAAWACQGVRKCKGQQVYSPILARTGTWDLKLAPEQQVNCNNLHA